MNINIKHKIFGDIDLNDEFFLSLKEDYTEFEDWFLKKQKQDAFVQYDENDKIIGFLYLKEEFGVVDDVFPPIEAEKILKIGTFKIDSHGTRMGEQFVKIIMDYAINGDVDVCYVTIFEKQDGLINLLKTFGFEEHGIKGDRANPEKVFVKSMKTVRGDVNKDYPLIKVNRGNKYLLSIYPQYHSVMFPDSILTTENRDIITDISYTNSIHKIYVCTMGVEVLKRGDIIVLYRTADNGRNAEYSAVATSICIVEEVKDQNMFDDFEHFYEYANQYSVFGKEDLRYWYQRGGCKAIKMTYNVALKRRIVRHDLITKVGMDRDAYWGFMPISDEQFYSIVKLGEINENILA